MKRAEHTQLDITPKQSSSDIEFRPHFYEWADVDEYMGGLESENAMLREALNNLIERASEFAVAATVRELEDEDEDAINKALIRAREVLAAADEEKK